MQAQAQEYQQPQEARKTRTDASLKPLEEAQSC